MDQHDPSPSRTRFKSWIKSIQCIVIVVLLTALYFLGINWDNGMMGSTMKWPHDAHNDDKHLILIETKHTKFALRGWSFDQSGKSKKYKAEAVSSLVHSFFPYVEKQAGATFIDPMHDNKVYANSPAISWYKGALVLVARICLHKERPLRQNRNAKNQFMDNFLYTQKYNRYMRPLDNGSMIGIPAPYYGAGDGPRGPNLFLFKKKLYVSFNVVMLVKKNQHIDTTVMWDYDEKRPILPSIVAGSPMMKAKSGMVRDKHWAAFTKHNQLHFVHNLDPLTVLQCNITGECIEEETYQKEKLEFHDLISHLRGGSPFERYRDMYYISVAHSVLFKKPTQVRYYTAHLVVMDIDHYRIVYVSDDIHLHSSIYDNIPMVRSAVMKDNFFFPCSLIIEDPNSFIIGGHINDYSTILIRLKGIENMLTTVLDDDISRNITRGPPAWSINKFIKESMTNKTKYDFF